MRNRWLSLLLFFSLGLPAWARPHVVVLDGLQCGSNYEDHKVNKLNGEFNRTAGQKGRVAFDALKGPTHFETDSRSGQIVKVRGLKLMVDGKPYELKKKHRDFETAYGVIRAHRTKTGFSLTIHQKM